MLGGALQAAKTDRFFGLIAESMASARSGAFPMGSEAALGKDAGYLLANRRPWLLAG
jgi:hypothetical protein